MLFFSMKGLKGPDIDGIQPIFYQKSWDIVHDTTFKFVEEALREGKVDLAVLKVHLVLIPKGSRSTSVKDYRPITLLNTSYNILSKVLVNRLRLVL